MKSFRELLPRAEQLLMRLDDAGGLPYEERQAKHLEVVESAIRDAEARGLEFAADIVAEYGLSDEGPRQLKVDDFKEKYGHHMLWGALRIAAARRRGGA